MKALENILCMSSLLVAVLVFSFLPAATTGFVIPAFGQSHQRCNLLASQQQSSPSPCQLLSASQTVLYVANKDETTEVQQPQKKRITQARGVDNSDSDNDSKEKNSDSGDDESFVQKVGDAKFMERNKHWVVLVDDEEAIRLAVGDYLYDQGYQVTACADADAFLDVCQRGKLSSKSADPDGSSSSSSSKSNNIPPKIPDVIVSDVRMPGLNGLELLALIKADSRLSRVPVILLTAKGMTADRVAGYKAGANVYLPKPFAPEELLSIVDNSIQRRRQMTSQKGSLVDMKQEMTDIKEIMKRNAETVVQKTSVYLTLVEREVLGMVCEGFTNKEIASERGVNVMTVIRVVQKLYIETETETRTELVRWAYKTGYVSKR